MALVELPLRKPKVALLGFIGIGLIGLVFASTLPRQEDPTFDWRKMDIVTVFPGADPETVETVVSKPLEESITELEDVVSVASQSRDGVSYLRVEIRSGTDYQRNFERVREKVAEVSRELPEQVHQPTVYDGDDLFQQDSFLVALTSEAPEEYGPVSLYHHAQDLEREFEDLSQVAAVDILGAPPDDIQVLVDLERMAKWRIDPRALPEALRSRNVRLPTGKLELGSQEVLLQAKGELETLQSIEELIVARSPRGEVVRVRDVANVQRGGGDPATILRHGGKRTVMLAIAMRHGGDVTRLASQVAMTLQQAQAQLPERLNAELVFDQSSYVKARFEILLDSIWQGVVLVLGVLFVFLGFKQALVAACGIPLAVLVGIVGMGLTGTPFQQFSIVGVLLSLGLLVDNIIVVVENCNDYLAEAKTSAFEAIMKATREVQGPLVSGTLTTVAAFLPLMFLGGDMGAFIYTMPLMVVLTLLSSLVVAIFFTPLQTFLFFRNNPVSHGGFRKRFLGVFSRAFKWLRRRRLAVVGLVLAMVALAVYLVPIVGVHLFPKEDRGMLIIRLEMPPGTSIEATDEVFEEARRVLEEEIPETRGTLTFVGRAVPHIYYNLLSEHRYSNLGQLLWLASDDPERRGVEEIARELRRLLPKRLPGANVSVREIEQGPAIQAPIVIRLEGDDLLTLRQEAEKLEGVIREVSGVTEVRNTLGRNSLALDIDLNLEKANLLGLSRQEVAATLGMLMQGGSATTVREGDEEREVVIRLRPEDRQDAEALEKLYIYSPASQENVPLRQIASLDLTGATSRIDRHDLRRTIDVEAFLEGRLASDVLAEVRQDLSDYEPPAGYEMEFLGERKEVNESFQRAAIAGLFSLMFIYVLLVAQFTSLSQPLAIFTVLPMAISGGIVGLFLTGNHLGFMAVVGIAGLSGIVVNDAILLIQFVNNSREQGMGLQDALDEAIERRTNPIISTTLTTVGGMLPLALIGGELWAAVCFVLIFGLLSATVGTLVFLPTVVEGSERLMGLFARPRGRIRVVAVDDELDMLETIEDILLMTDEGFRVETTTLPLEALELIRSFDPHVVVLDYMMPDRDGLDLVSAIRDVRPKLPIVMLTAFGSVSVQGTGMTSSLAAEAILQGADSFLSKEELDSLPDVVEQLVERPQRKRLPGRVLDAVFGRS